MKRVLFAIAVFLPAWALAQDPCIGINAAKKRIYGFHLSNLSAKAAQARLGEMDSFWELVKSVGTRGAACLSATLKSETEDAFFLCDGSALLYTLDKSPSSLATITTSLYRADLNEVNPNTYLQLLISMSKHAVDIGPLAERFICQPKANVALPAHATTFDRITCGIVLYGSMPAASADKYLIPLLGHKDQQVRSVAALALAVNLTEEAFKTLKAFTGMSQLPEEVRKEVAAYMKYDPPEGAGAPEYSREQVLGAIRRAPLTEPERLALWKKYLDKKTNKLEEISLMGIAGHEDFAKSAVVTLTAGDLGELREARRMSVRLSDEGLDEFFAYTLLIEGIINRLDLYKKYRVHEPERRKKECPD